MPPSSLRHLGRRSSSRAPMKGARPSRGCPKPHGQCARSFQPPRLRFVLRVGGRSVTTCSSSFMPGEGASHHPLTPRQ
eukprot:8118962-Alexandrium_andersonii.AAC.1